ncbi:MAG: alanine--tRNA ligase [Bacteroidales bacterium]|nr:alanine--tRNA ligase [Bacteroidales bacterium]
MTSYEIRKTFLDFFASKGHTIVPSSPITVKNDPTLLFTNAGMNQFKDIFLGNVTKPYPSAADSQKCLRVSGKHNDLEEVGHDTYHHTMFEMLGNWSFGDYFKKEAIAYAWELLTKVYGISKNVIYVTVFQGDEKDGLSLDKEAYDYWKEWIDEDRIILGNKKDNFWEMGETGPCGACSEIHVDLRDEEERKKVSGKDLVNKDNPLVIEIWNLVFMEFNRMADGSLVPLKEKNIDTGMGFERLCMVLQNKKSNYDTDVFQPMIQFLAKEAKVTYSQDKEKDVAMRVCADHIRAISFAIADGQLPSNAKAGYVIRRILRRAVRYGYTFLNFNEPFLYKLVDVLVNKMGEQYPEIKQQQSLIEKIVKEEEQSFLRTLSNGIIKFEKYISQKQDKVIDGDFTFELFDTYGFPVDLTELMAQEKGYSVDMQGFEKNLAQQKERSKNAAKSSAEDWVIIKEFEGVGEFLGYDTCKANANLLRYRKVTTKTATNYQLVFDQTPFYAEMGGQVGDSGYITNGVEKIEIIDTQKENKLTLHITKKLPENLEIPFELVVNQNKRTAIEANHTATHLLHYALRQVLGSHVEQKGSYVNDSRLRFDFSHPSKLTEEEIRQTEKLVNSMIRADHKAEDFREINIEEAQAMGAMALFGEKYGDKVRCIRFGESIELCGGTHASSTGRLGMISIVNETAVAAGVRRIEAVTGEECENHLNKIEDTLKEVQSLFAASPNIVKTIQKLIEDNNQLKAELDSFQKEKIAQLYDTLQTKITEENGVSLLTLDTSNLPAEGVKDLAFRFRASNSKICFIGYGESEGKVNLTLMLGEELVEKGKDASATIRQVSKEIKGGGGGQKHFATAGGKDASGLAKAVELIKEIILA